MRVFLAVLLTLVSTLHAEPLPGTRPLSAEGDLSAQMVDGISRWLDHETHRVTVARAERWRGDGEALAASLPERRERLRRMLGAVDPMLNCGMEVLGGELPRELADGAKGFRVRWPVFEHFDGEGWLLMPPDLRLATVVAIPDADVAIGEFIESETARRLVGGACRVFVPDLVTRRTDYSGSKRIDRKPTQPHREWLHRPAFQMGRTLTGYEVREIEAGIAALSRTLPGSPFGIWGEGEGGLIALHLAALRPELLRAAVITGHFGPRERLWEEPIYRNLFGVLREFGDAEVAALFPRGQLIIDPAPAPPVDGLDEGATPGRLVTPTLDAVRSEVARANEMRARVPHSRPVEIATDHVSALVGLMKTLDAEPRIAPPIRLYDAPNVQWSQQRTVRDLQEHTQRLLRLSDSQRATKLWASLKKPAEFSAAQQELRRELWEKVIGKLPTDYLPPNPRTRALPSHEMWTGHEVVLDVLPDVFAWGWLLVPKDLKPGERRPVVVCQHGLEGLPEDVVNEDPKSRAFGFYKGFASQLAARGFIVYAPHNPYRGKDAFRLLQRKANPLGLSLFSFIVAQHDVTTRWLATLPFVDPERIAFYGLSYGGKTAMRVPALLDRYCLSICSGDFNEWIGKVVSTAWGGNYPFTSEWEIPEWNLGHVAGYAEMAMLIAPRPFMVERGHDDGVALDQWVGYEWAKVQRGYDKLGLSERAEIEWFDGPHTIHGVGTFRFLHEHLGWPDSQP